MLVRDVAPRLTFSPDFIFLNLLLMLKHSLNYISTSLKILKTIVLILVLQKVSNPDQNPK